MPFNACPHKKESGYTASKRCTAPCGGWVVLYKRQDMDSPKVRDHADKSFQWVLVHQPSRQWTGIVKKEDALKYLTAAAKGEDPHAILPTTVPEPPTLVTLKKPKATPTKPKPSRTRAGEPSDPSEGGGSSSPPPPPPPPEDIPHALAFQRRMQEEFTADRIVAEIKAGLSAVKSYVTEGNVVSVPDHQTRVKYLDLAVKYNIGMPDKRDKLKEERKMSYEELQKLAETSPAARRTLRRMLDDAEKKAAEALKPAASNSSPQVSPS